MKAAAAIADPVRRQILEMLRDHPATAGQIAGRFTISRPAISRHLRVLRDSRLVAATVTGRQRIYTIDATALREIAAWIAQFEPAAAWEQRFDALETEVARTRGERRGSRQHPHHWASGHDQLEHDQHNDDQHNEESA